MYKEIAYNDLRDEFIFIDVRSPHEYSHYTIPGAINIPIFDNEERNEIGTIYKQVSVDAAKRRGIEIVSKKLLEMYDKIVLIKKQHRNVIIFCERGGMRSSSICSLLASLGVSVAKLKGGYKAYRAAVVNMLPLANENVNYIVLHGFTGTGKTEMLNLLEKNGHEVLNLEKIANHRGSLLGDVGLGNQVTQKQFESIVLQKLNKFRGKNVFVEAESGRIGNIIVPKYIIEKMRNGKHILVNADINVRANLIVKEYITNKECIEELIRDIKKLEKYIGKNNVNEYCNSVNNGSYHEVACDLMNKHYDPLYYKSQIKYKYDIEVDSADISKACKEIEIWKENSGNEI